MVARQALLILDMSNDLVHRDGKKAANGYHEHVSGRNVLERTATAIARARAGARRGQAAEGESAVAKRRVSPFHGTHLDLLLRKQRVDTSCSPGWRPTWSFCRLPVRTIATIGPPRNTVMVQDVRSPGPHPPGTGPRCCEWLADHLPYQESPCSC